MAIIAVRRPAKNGLRPLLPSKDLLGVANLIEEAFAGEMDRTGRRALREMRWMGRWGVMLLWLDYLSPDVNTYLNGFVWLEDGKIVGNTTVSRSSADGRRWFISNVAVLKTYRGQGIARAMMAAALDFVHQMRGNVISLQVRQGNAPAIHLYKSLGFIETGGVTQFFLPKITAPQAARLPAGIHLRHHHLDMIDARDTYSLARLVIPDGLQRETPLKFNAFRLDGNLVVENFFRKLIGRGEREYWVAEDVSGRTIATLKIEPGTGNKEHSIGFLVHPQWQGKLEKALIGKALTALARYSPRPVMFQYPEDLTDSGDALMDAGFTKRRILLWMRHKM